MSTSKKTKKYVTKARRVSSVHGNSGESSCPVQIQAVYPLTLWRTLDAQQFGSRDVKSLRALLAKTSLLGQPKWAAAVNGDASAAVAVAVSFIPVDELTLPLDLAMTALIACAVEGDPGAAIVASNILLNLPSASPRHHQIAASWFVSDPTTVRPIKRTAATTQASNFTKAGDDVHQSSEYGLMVPDSFKLWRTIPAHAFDNSRRLAVIGFVAEYLARINDKAWKAAVSGDTVCAIRIAQEIAIPADEFTYPVDARMMLLLYCALKGSAEAALALSSLLRKMPLEEMLRNRLAASWLVHSRHVDESGELDVAPRRRHLSLVSQALGNREARS